MVYRQEKIELELEALITAPLEVEGFEVVAIEYFQSHQGKLLRVFVDKPEGVTLGDCESVNRTINRLLEAHEISDLKYQEFHVEVSSPGLDRIVRKKKDFERFEGKSIEIQLRESLSAENNKRKYTGILKGMKNDMVLIETEASVIEIPWNKIKTAHIKYEFGERRER